MRALWPASLARAAESESLSNASLAFAGGVCSVLSNASLAFAGGVCSVLSNASLAFAGGVCSVSPARSTCHRSSCTAVLTRAATAANSRSPTCLRVRGVYVEWFAPYSPVWSSSKSTFPVSPLVLTPTCSKTPHHLMRSVICICEWNGAHLTRLVRPATATVSHECVRNALP